MRLKQPFYALLLTLLAPIFFVGCNPGGPRGEIIEHGIYEVTAPGTAHESSETTSGTERRGATTRLVERATRVPLERDRMFGFKYRIQNLSDQASAELKWVVIHPEMTKPDGTKSTGYEQVRKVRIAKGEAQGQAGYVLNHDFELVEGEWTFQCWQGDRKLLQQKFVTYRP